MNISIKKSSALLGVEPNLLYKTICSKMNKQGLPIIRRYKNYLDIQIPIYVHDIIKSRLDGIFSSLTDYEDIFKSKTNRVDYKYVKFPVLYFLFNQNELVYIGMTYNINTRLSDHKKTKTFDEFYIERSTHLDVAIMEMAYINKYVPPLNVKIATTNSLIRAILDTLDIEFN